MKSMRKKGFAVVFSTIMAALGIFTGCKSSDVVIKIEKISVQAPSSAFAVDTNFSRKDFTVKGTKTDNAVVAIDPEECVFECNGKVIDENTVLSETGDFTVKVKYEDLTAESRFSVRSYTGITVSAVQSKFSLNSSFAKDNFVVKAVLEGGGSKRIPSSDCVFECDGISYTNSTILRSEGTFTVTVTYKGYTANCSFSVGGFPTYSDNYSNIAGWSNKDKWNLANTHDPTVFYWDGYYYMFGTDASYGNEHNKAPNGKHFQGKRSLDLINWEWVPGPFNSCPEWVNTKLNEIRASMGLSSINMATAENAAIIGYWAPSARVVTVNGVQKVRMYYSIVCDYYIGSGKPNIAENYDGTWSERAMIGVCETTNPNGGPSAWTDLGFVVCSSSDLGKNYNRSSSSNWDGYFYFNAIDPSYFIDDDGSHWMVYGSWHSGIAITRINPETGKIATVDGNDYLTGNVTGDFPMGDPFASSAEGLKQNGYGTRIYTRARGSRWQGSEGPELIKYNGKYYLFLANDGLDIPYHSRVLKADKVTGPYKDITGTDYTNGGNGNPLPVVTHPYKFDGNTYGWVGFGHCALFQDTKGDWFYMSQARLPADVPGINVSNALMMGHVRRIEWVPASAGSTDIWPVVSPERYAGLDMLPANTITVDEIVGEWENINLEYKFRTMDTASLVTFTKTSEAGGTVSGALSGDWSFDAEKNLLKIGTKEFKVERECDWEANPRKETLVYSGVGSGNVVLWGKKKELVSVIPDSSSSDPVNCGFTGTYTSDNWWGFTDHPYVTVEANSSVKTKYVNNSYGASSWSGAVYVLNSADGVKEYAVCRNDNYGWFGAINTGEKLSELGWTLTNDWNGEDIASFMNGAEVTVTVKNYNGTADVLLNMKKGNVTHYQYYKNIKTDGGAIRFTFNGDAGANITYMED